jgi:hypothetical protein
MFKYVLFVFAFIGCSVAFADDRVIPPTSSELQEAVDTYCKANSGGLETTPKSPWSFNVSGGIWSKYLCKNNFVAHDEAIVWADIAVTYDRLTFDIWRSSDLDSWDLDNGYDDEEDFTFTWSDLLEVGTQKIKWSAFAAYYILHPSSADVSMMDIGLTSSIPNLLPLDITPSLKVAYQPVFGGPDSGWQVEGGFTKSLDLEDGFSIDLGLKGVYNSGVFGLDGGWNTYESVGVSWKSGDFKVSLAFESFHELSGRSDRESWNSRVGLSVSIDF